MSRLYVARWVLHEDSYVPDGTQDLRGWAAIDLTPSGGIKEPVHALVSVPDGVSLPARDGLELVTDDPLNDDSPGIRNRLRDRVPVNLETRGTAGLHLRRWLVDEADDRDPSRPNALRPSRLRGQYEIRLRGELLWSTPVVRGGATYTETFPTDDAEWGVLNSPGTLLTNQDNDWVQDGNDFGSVSGGRFVLPAFTITRYTMAADADGTDLYAKTTVYDWGVNQIGPVMVRRPQPNAGGDHDDTGYVAWFGTTTDRLRIRRRVTGSNTTLTDDSNVAGVDAEFIVQISADGSTIAAEVDGTEVNSTTDTGITTGTRAGWYEAADNSAPNTKMGSWEFGDLGGGGEAYSDSVSISAEGDVDATGDTARDDSATAEAEADANATGTTARDGSVAESAEADTDASGESGRADALALDAEADTSATGESGRSDTAGAEAVASIEVTGTAARADSVTIEAEATSPTTGATARTGSVTLEADGDADATGAASEDGAGDVTIGAIATVDVSGTSSRSGDATLEAIADSPTTGSTARSDGATLEAEADTVADGTSEEVGSGDAAMSAVVALSVSGTAHKRGDATVTAEADTDATGAAAREAAVTIEAIATVETATETMRAAVVTLSAVAVLTITVEEIPPVQLTGVWSPTISMAGAWSPTVTLDGEYAPDSTLEGQFG